MSEESGYVKDKYMQGAEHAGRMLTPGWKLCSEATRYTAPQTPPWLVTRGMACGSINRLSLSRSKLSCDWYFQHLQTHAHVVR